MTKRIAVGMIGLLVVATVLWVLWPSGGTDQELSQGTSPRSGQAEDGSGDEKKSKNSQNRTIELVSISGVVVDEKGGPIPGAVVLVDSVSGVAIFNLDSSLPNTTIADKEGRWKYSELNSGKLRITASGSGYLPLAPVEIVVKAGKSHDDIRIVLREGGHALSGTISDIGGGPVESANVVATRSSGFATDAYSLAITDDKGEYQLQLEAGEYSIVVTHQDYVEKLQPVKIASPRTLDISLLPAAAIYGRVVNTDGEIIANARVYASGGQEKNERSGPVAGTADTNDKGEFVLRRLSSGSYSVHAVAPGYASAESVDVELGIAESLSDVVLVVDSAHSVSGKVVQNEDKSQGIQGVQVMAANMRSQVFATAIVPTDEEGGFVIHGVLPGNYTVMAFHDERLGSFMEANVTMIDKDIDDVEISLKQGAVVRGRVEPATIANIGLEVEDPGFFNMKDVMMAQGAKTVSDAEGNFELKMAPQGEFLLNATSKDGRRGEIEILIQQTTHEGIVVTLVEGYSLSGQVVDQKGDAVIGVRVRAVAMSEEKHMMMRMGPGTQQGFPVNEKGEFRIRGLEEGSYRVTVLDSRGQLPWAGPSDKANAVKEIEIAGKDKANQVLKVKRANGVIEGSVLGIDGAPVVDAWVHARRGNPKMLAMISDRDAQPADEDVFRWGEKEEPVLTDASGRFRIPGLRDGQYQITASSPAGNDRAEKNKVKPGSDITLELQALKSIRAVVTQGGQPVDRYTLRLSGFSERVYEVRDGASEYVFSKVKDGDYTLSAVTDSTSASKEFTVGQEPEVVVTLDLKSFCGLKGKVVDIFTKQPLPGLLIMTMGGGVESPMEEGMNMFSGDSPTTDANGHFALPALLCKTGTLLFLDRNSMNSGSPGATKDYELEDGVKELGTIYMVSKPELPEAERANFGFEAIYDESSTTAKVSTVAKGGAAEAAGLSSGDLIRTVEQVEVAELGTSLFYAVLFGKSTAVGDILTLEVVDGAGKAKEIQLTAIKASVP